MSEFDFDEQPSLKLIVTKYDGYSDTVFWFEETFGSLMHVSSEEKCEEKFKGLAPLSEESRARERTEESD